jgi:hypothetical protein
MYRIMFAVEYDISTRIRFKVYSLFIVFFLFSSVFNKGQYKSLAALSHEQLRVLRSINLIYCLLNPPKPPFKVNPINNYPQGNILIVSFLNETFGLFLVVTG